MLNIADNNPEHRNIYFEDKMIAEMVSTVSAAAYVAGVSERDVNRVFDENLLPSALISAFRSLTPLGCVLASFYFREASTLTAELRKSVVSLIGNRHSTLRTWAALARPASTNWDVEVGAVLIRLSSYAQEARGRGESLAKAEALVETDADVLDGQPVFKGTRVPVRTIAAWISDGIDHQLIQRSYPNVTDEMVSAASVWSKAHPKRGRPRKFNEINPDWTVKSVSTRKPGDS